VRFVPTPVTSPEKLVVPAPADPEEPVGLGKETEAANRRAVGGLCFVQVGARQKREKRRGCPSQPPLGGEEPDICYRSVREGGPLQMVVHGVFWVSFCHTT